MNQNGLKRNILKVIDIIRYPNKPRRRVEKNYNFAQNTNYEVCKECGGLCCLNCGCHYSPEDFKDISYKYLKKEIEKGYISIDYVRGKDIGEKHGAFILRVRNIKSPIVDYKRKRGKPCILFDSKNGCKLSYKERPTGGKLFKPSDKFYRTEEDTLVRCCYPEYRIKDCVYEWRPYQRRLKKLCKYFDGKDFPSTL